MKEYNMNEYIYNYIYKMCGYIFIYYVKIFFYFKEQIIYNVYLISISYIYLPYFILLYI